MIEIIKYGEMLQDIRGKVNQQLEPYIQIAGTILSPVEKHLIKKLKDVEGIWLCANYPSCSENSKDTDNVSGKNECLFLLLEKVPSGKHTDGEELVHYAKMQRIMLLIKELLIEANFTCDYTFQSPSHIRIEWEYEITGGWNGLSIGFELDD